jgi:hypothetical protein
MMRLVTKNPASDDLDLAVSTCISSKACPDSMRSNVNQAFSRALTFRSSSKADRIQALESCPDDRRAMAIPPEPMIRSQFA